MPPVDEDEQLVAALRGALDGPLARHGFAVGQGGSGDGHVQVLFCCPEDDFRVRHPGVLPDPHEPGPWGCVDLVVDLDRTAAPQVDEVRLEAEQLTALLARQGKLAAVEEARSLGDQPIEQALHRLTRLVLLALDG